MYVQLIAATPNPEQICGVAAMVCRHADEAQSNVAEEYDNDRLIKLCMECKNSGHLSVFEHASFTFFISGISRVCSHQLVRHRLASYTQASQRAEIGDDVGYIMPSTIAGATERTYDIHCKNAVKLYNTLLMYDVPKEDARFVLPQAFTTSIVVTMNARELLHFFELRLCEKAQWEIRELANEMLDQVKPAFPLLFEDAGPTCKYRPCPERNKCQAAKDDQTYKGEIPC